jgi:hypothetical protein
MAKSVPLPSLKKPSAGLPMAAMEQFLSETSLPAAPTLTLAPQHETAEEASTTPLEQVEVVAESSESPRHSRKPKVSKQGRRLVARVDGSSARKVTLYLAPDLDRKLSLYALENGIDRSSVVAELLAKYLKP